MSATGGYDSDVNLQDIQFVGDFPLENSLGGFGVTTGTGNNYVLGLNPSITAYRIGMRFEVQFNNANSGAATLDVDGQGVASLKKIVNGALVELSPNDLNSTGIYDLVFDGSCLQVVNGIEVSASSLPQASEIQAGVSRFGNDAEVDTGLADNLGVSVKQLSRFVGDKVTGLWTDKGLIDASVNPNYPAGTKGDAYTFSAAGKIGGAAGINVEVRDVIYCINDNAGGDEATVGADWNIIQTNIDQATDLIAGVLRIGTTVEAVAGGLTDVAITPKTLSDVLATVLVQASQTVVGGSRFATTPETLAGLLLDVGISPATLKDRLDNYLNREAPLSIAAIDINPNIRTTSGRNRYVAINGNLIIGKDIRLKPTIPIPATFGFVHILNFPKPLSSPTPHQPTTLSSSIGNQFILQMDVEGRVFLSGTFGSGAEELILNLTPYVAKFPLEFHGTPPPS